MSDLNLSLGNSGAAYSTQNQNNVNRAENRKLEAARQKKEASGLDTVSKAEGPDGKGSLANTDNKSTAQYSAIISSPKLPNPPEVKTNPFAPKSELPKSPDQDGYQELVAFMAPKKDGFPDLKKGEALFKAFTAKYPSGTPENKALTNLAYAQGDPQDIEPQKDFINATLKELEAEVEAQGASAEGPEKGQEPEKAVAQKNTTPEKPDIQKNNAEKKEGTQAPKTPEGPKTADKTEKGAETNASVEERPLDENGKPIEKGEKPKTEAENGKPQLDANGKPQEKQVQEKQVEKGQIEGQVEEVKEGEAEGATKTEGSEEGEAPQLDKEGNPVKKENKTEGKKETSGDAASLDPDAPKLDAEGNPIDPQKLVDADGNPIAQEAQKESVKGNDSKDNKTDKKGKVGADGKPVSNPNSAFSSLRGSTDKEGEGGSSNSGGSEKGSEGAIGSSTPSKGNIEAGSNVRSTTASLTTEPETISVSTGKPTIDPAATSAVQGGYVAVNPTVATVNTTSSAGAVDEAAIEAAAVASGQPIDPETGLNDISGELSAFHDQIKTMSNQVGDIRVKIEAMPSSKDKSIMLEYLAKISAAIITFTEILNNLQAYDSGKTRVLSAAKLTDTLAKLAKQKKAIRKQRQKASKGKSKGVKQVFDKIMKSVTVAIILVTAWLLVICSAGLLTPVSAILVAQAVDMCMKMAGKEGVWSRMYEGVENLASVWGKAMGMSSSQIERFKVALKSIVMAVLLILVAGPTFIVGGDAMKSILFEADMIKNKIAQMVIGILIDVTIAAVQIVVAIAIAIISFGGGGATIQLIFAPIIQIMNAAMGGVKMATTVKVAMEVIQYSMMIVNVTYSVVTQTQAIVTSVAKMKLNKQIGNLELDIKMRETMIELLKKLIQSLQESISGLSSAVSAVAEGHNNMMKSLSQTMSQLYTT